LDGHQKSKLAETAILFRLILHKFNAFKPVSDWDTGDWFVEDPNTSRTFRVQVRCVKRERYGLPVVSLRKVGNKGKSSRFKDDDFDFIVGYDAVSDEAYVFSSDEVSGNLAVVAVRPDALERWDKLGR
jgi:hypothetical protein